MCDTSTIPPIKPKYRFKTSTIYSSVDFLKSIADMFFINPFVNCSKETPVDWSEYLEIQYKTFMEYLERIFTKEFLELRNDKFYYSLIEFKVRDNYNKYLKFFEKNTN